MIIIKRRGKKMPKLTQRQYRLVFWRDLVQMRSGSIFQPRASVEFLPTAGFIWIIYKNKEIVIELIAEQNQIKPEISIILYMHNEMKRSIPFVDREMHDEPPSLSYFAINRRFSHRIRERWNA